MIRESIVQYRQVIFECRRRIQALEQTTSGYMEMAAKLRGSEDPNAYDFHQRLMDEMLPMVAADIDLEKRIIKTAEEKIGRISALLSEMGDAS